MARPLALCLVACVFLLAKKSGGRRAADAAEAAVYSEAEKEAALPPPAAAAAPARSPAQLEADAALGRVNIASVPRPMLRASAIASIAVQAALAAAAALPLAHVLLGDGPPAPALRGAGLALLLALTVAHHALALALVWRSTWRLDWRTSLATAQKALSLSGATGSLARASSTLGGRTGGTLVRTQGAAFDWSAFPDVDSDEDEENAGAGATGTTGTNGTGVRRNNPVYDIASGSGTLGAGHTAARGQRPGHMRGYMQNGMAEPEYLASAGTDANDAQAAASRGFSGRELYTVTQPLADEAPGSFEVIQLGGSIVTQRRASEELFADNNDVHEAGAGAGAREGPGGANDVHHDTGL